MLTIHNAATPAPSGLTIRNLRAEEDFTVTLIPRTVNVTAGTAGTQTVKDVNLVTFIGAVTKTYSDLSLSQPLFGQAQAAPTFSSDNPGVLTVDASGALAYVAPGTATITAHIAGLGTKKYDVTAAFNPSAAGSTFGSFVTGSLGRHLADQIATRIAGKTAPTYGVNPPYARNPLVSLCNDDGTRNTGGWWGGVDFTGIPYKIGANGVLVSPRDMIFAAHYFPGIRYDVRFEDAAGNFHDRTVVTWRIISSPTGDGRDICIGTLDSDLPGAIAPFKLLPANFRNYLPQPQHGYPCVFTNQDRALLIGDTFSLSIAGSAGIIRSNDASRSPWYYLVRPGDSGSPAFMLINGVAVLVTNWHFTGAGPNHADNIGQINAAMTANGSPYAVSTVNLTGFSTY